MAIGNVTFGGLGSGLPADMVDKLMSTEQARLKSLEANKSYFADQKKAFSDLRTKMLALRTKAKELETTSNWTPHTASSSVPDKLGVTASSTASAGIHSVQVHRLATNNALVSSFVVGNANATLTSSRDMSFTYNGVVKTVALAAGDTLQGIANKINAVDYGTEKGVSASVMNDGTGYRLVMTAKDSGAYQRDAGGATTQERLHSLALSGAESFSDGTTFPVAAGMTQTQSGVDAQLTADGVSNIFKSTNTVSDLFTGVTLDLKDVTTGSATVTIANDPTAVTSKLQGFVDSFNSVVDYVESQKGKGEPFQGESVVRSVLSQIRSEFNTSSTGASGDYKTLASMGITTDWETGKLSIDSDKLTDALSNDFNAPVDVFAVTTGNQGLGYRLDTMLNKLTDSVSGTIAGKQKGLDGRIDMYSKRIVREEARLENLREMLTKRFAHLDSLVSSLNSSGSQMMSSLNALG